MNHTTLFVSFPNLNLASAAHQASRADDHLNAHGAMFHRPTADAPPIPNEHGEYEVRCLGDAGFPIFVLEQHYGATVRRVDES